jgi:putative ABC transport system permease protein
MTATRALLRMARRQVWRNKARSVLIVALIAFPVAMVSMGEVLYRSDPLSVAQQLEEQLGNADARLTANGGPGAITQSPDGGITGSSVSVSGVAAPVGGAAEPTQAQLQALLPGSRLLPEYNDQALVKTPDGAVAAALTGVDLGDASFRPAFRLTAGSWRAGAEDVVIGDDLAKAAAVGVGDTLTLRRPAATLRVAGIVHDRYQNHYRYAAVLPDTYTRLGGSTDTSSWLVKRAAGVSWPDVLWLNQHGVTAYSRLVMLNPPPKSQVPQAVSDAGTSVTKKAAVTLAVAVGMAVLQLALLAGPAFAVSARRRQRELALIAASGGDRPVLRRTLLAEGLVLGVLAAAAGVALGLGFAACYRGLSGQVLGPLRPRPEELLAVAALGVIAALVGALLPAHWAARLDVVAALAGRRGTTRAPWRASVLGVAAIALGVVLGLIGATQAEALLILPGLAACELGVLALTPGILSLAGLLAPRLPVALRIALRDASRNRTAAVPALAAVLAAVTASVSIAIFAASVSAKDRLEYRPQLPANLAMVFLSDSDADTSAAAVRDLRTYLSTNRVDVLQSGNCGSSDCHSLSVERAQANICNPSAMGPTDPRCVTAKYEVGFDVLVLAPDQLAAVATKVEPADVRALQDGRILVPSQLDLSGSDQVLAQLMDPTSGDEPARSLLPAAVLSHPGPLRFSAIVSPALASRLHLAAAPTTVLASLSSRPTPRQEEALAGALADYDLGVDIEHGYTDGYRYAIVASLIAALVIAMGATALATALAVVDSRPDLATLWAIGAGPGVRRRLSVARAAVVALIGVLLGSALGFLPPLVVIDNQRRRSVGFTDFASRPVPHPFAVPWWPNIIGTAVLIPLGAMLIAAVMTRSRPPKPTATP